jgi:hypothetical protein
VEVEGALLVAVAVWFGASGWWARVRFGGLMITLRGEWQGQGNERTAELVEQRCGAVEGWAWWEGLEWWRGSGCWPSRSLLEVGVALLKAA